MILLKRFRIYFISSAALLTIFSMTFLIMPFVNDVDAGYQRKLFLMVGLCFWISLLAGYLFLFLAAGVSKKIYKLQEIECKKGNKVPEILRLASNEVTSVTDTLFLVEFLY